MLEWADTIATYALVMIIAFLTKKWRIGYITASNILNIFWGTAKILPVLFIRPAVASHKAEFRILAFSSLVYTLGLCLLTLAVENGNKGLFGFALVLIAGGMAGESTTRESFIEKQRQTTTWDLAWHIKIGLSICAAIGIKIVGAVIGFIPSWNLLFGVAAAISLMSTLIFFTGICVCTYNYAGEQEHPLELAMNLVCMVICIPIRIFNAILKTLCPCAPQCIFRFIDKLSSTESAPQQASTSQKRSGEGKSRKIALHLIPMWMTFLMCGVVSSTGKTYFLAQANSMKNYHIPITILVLFSELVKLLGKFYFELSKCFFISSNQNRAPTFGIAIAMILSIISCIVAAKVEEKRQNNNSMSMFSLLPQFLLLGGLDGIYESSVTHFFVEGLPLTKKKYIPIFADAVFGVGIISNILLVFILQKITGNNNNNNGWFVDDINQSDLDKYYWVLATLSSVNLGVYILTVICFPGEFSTSNDATSGTTSSMVPCTGCLNNCFNHLEACQRICCFPASSGMAYNPSAGAA